MISRSDDRRRVLDLPAVRPCESVFPSTLLASLIALSQSICSPRSRARFFFSTQRRNARESIRLAGVLLVFFEHLLDRPPSLLRNPLLLSPSPSSSPSSSSLVVALSELHFALQKLLFLLEDCGSRPGARVWLLMNSRLVAAQFQIAVRSIATALDVMPDLNRSGIGDDAAEDSDLEEVREVVRMVGRQARKARWEAVEIGDQLAAERVSFVLNQFENRYEPERGLIKRVLDYLGIRTWTECNQEVKFLEEEITSRCTVTADVDGQRQGHGGRRGGGSGGEKRISEEDRDREMPLLSSLLALMCYCRGVIFDDDHHHHLASSTDDRLIVPSPSAGAGEEGEDSSSSSYVLLRCLNPEDFRCPISLELMTDPVTVSTGQTYDRVSIQKWLRSGNMICPKTGERLTSRDLVPNSALKRLIHHFFSDYGISISKSSSSSSSSSSSPRDPNVNTTTTTTAAFPGPSIAARESLRFLCEFLTARLTYGTDHHKTAAAHESRLLAKLSVYTRTLLVDVGAVPPLLDLLTSPTPLSQENSISALLKLSKHPSGQKSIVENGGLTLIVSVVRNGHKPESRQIAAAVVFYLASAGERYRRWIGRNRDSIPALVELFRDGTVCGKRNAMAALFALLIYHGNRERALMAGVVPDLIDVVGGGGGSGRGELVGDALAILAALAEGVDGSVAILQSKGLETVMGVVKTGGGAAVGRAGREYCVSVLVSLCAHGGEEVVDVMAREESGQVMPFLYGMSVVEGSVGKKARGLINMLQMHRESSTSSSSRRLVAPQGCAAAAVCKQREDDDH